MKTAAYFCPAESGGGAAGFWWPPPNPPPGPPTAQAFNTRTARTAIPSKKGWYDFIGFTFIRSLIYEAMVALRASDVKYVCGPCKRWTGTH